MGALGGLLGTAGGSNGTGFGRPTQANINSPVSTEQVGAANQGVNGALGNANSLLAALQGQGASGQQLQNLQGVQGLGQQLGGNNNVGAQGQAMGGQGALNQQLAGTNSVANQVSGLQGLQRLVGQQQGLANQLQGVANGTGPNPAQAALNQTTGQNVANQASLMAGQRGAGANVGLMARQAAQQGAATQQQAAGQSATMQAQQELNAMAQLGQQQQAMAGTNQGIFNSASGLSNQLQEGLGQQFGQGQAGVGQQQAQQGLAAGITQNQMGNLINTQGQVTQGNVANAGQQMGALGNYNTSAVNMQGNVNNANTSLANTNMQGQQAMLGGAMNGAGSAMSAASGARGGMVAQRMAEGGEAEPYAAPAGQGPVMAEPPPPAAPGPAPVTAPPPGPQSALGQFLAGGSTGAFAGSQPIESTAQTQTPDTTASAQIQAPPQMGYGSQMLYKGASNMTKGAEKMGMMAAAGARGGLASEGGHVEAKSPEQKATKAGNSYSNDKVPALLSEGEVVIPRSVMQGKDPARGAADFVAKVMAKRRAS